MSVHRQLSQGYDFTDKIGSYTISRNNDVFGKQFVRCRDDFTQCSMIKINGRHMQANIRIYGWKPKHTLYDRYDAAADPKRYIQPNRHNEKSSIQPYKKWNGYWQL